MTLWSRSQRFSSNNASSCIVTETADARAAVDIAAGATISIIVSIDIVADAASRYLAYGRCYRSLIIPRRIHGNSKTLDSITNYLQPNLTPNLTYST